jgi:sortase (surface protein transpeptidase)
LAVPLLVAGLLGAGLAGVVAALSPDDPTRGRPLPPQALAPERGLVVQDAGPAPSAGPGPLVDVVDEQAPPPRRISIPAIRVSAHIIPLRLNPDHTMQTPRAYTLAGWYEPGVEPGERGPAVIVGHVDSRSGPAAFYRLRELHRGDVIAIVRADGSTVRFRVEGLERWPKTAFPTRRVFHRTPTSALRLVTCSGTFDPDTGHYADNTIVYAAREPVRRAVPAHD